MSIKVEVTINSLILHNVQACCIFIQLLETVCSYEDISYMFIIDTNNENVTQRLNINNTLGPYHQRGSDSILKTFTSEFKKDREYNLTLVIDTVAENLVSNIYSFSEYNMCDCYFNLLSYN